MSSEIGKVAVVTGSTSGIGLATARALARSGHHLLIHGLGDPAQIQLLRQELASEFKIRTSYSSADLQASDSGAALIAQAEKEFGRVDVLVNNAGIQYVSPLESFPTERWDAVIAINLSAAFHTTRAVLPGMRSRSFGRIINIASVHGLVASVHKAAYVAAKHGLIGLTKVTALETAGSGITCNAICPGWVRTPLVMKQIEARAQKEKITTDQAEKAMLLEKQPSGSFVTLEQIGELAAYLARDCAAAMTGSALPMDGGWTSQ